MNHRKKLHIIGAKGHLAKILVTNSSENFDLYLYSSNPTKSTDDKKLVIFFSLEDAFDMVGEGEPVIFLSHSNHAQTSIFLRQFIIKLSKNKPHLIFISTLAVYSRYRSNYAEIKTEFENLVQGFDQFSIIRLGFVYGRTFGGYSQVFRKLAKRRIALLPSTQIKTGFISQKSACKQIINVALEGPSQKITDTYDVFINFDEALKLFGFVGISIKTPNIFLKCLVAIYQSIRFLTPTSIQSLLSIAYLENQHFKNENSIPYLRCFLLRDYTRLFGANDKWKIRKYLKKIETNNSLSEYTTLNNSKRFMYLYRLREIIQIEVDQLNSKL